MESFHIMSTSKITEIIKKSPGKSCKSDPIPTNLLKKVLPACIDLIAEIVNQSLQTGIFPDRLKKALVKPLLKKINLVLGCIAFTMYTYPVGNICRENDVDAQFFADDEQMYLAFKPKRTDSQEQCTTTLEKCISETKTLMGSNRLRLNDDKTEFIIIGSRQQLSKIIDIAIK